MRASSRRLPALALAGIVAAACVSCNRSPRDELLAVYERSRPCKARLGGAEFLPHDSAVGARSHSTAFRRAARRIERAAAERRPAPRALGNIGLLHLFLGRPGKAVNALERAVAAAPQDALLLSDLAAAFVARADDGERPFDFVRALSAADRARRADPNFREALFNRALALEELRVPEAQRAWADLATVEEDPGWKREAEARLGRLRAQAAAEAWEKERGRLERAAERGETAEVETIVARFPQPARIHVEELLLARWAEEASAGRRDEASSTLNVARMIGNALLRRRGDAMVHDAVAALDETAAASGQSFRHLIDGHRHFGSGLRGYRAGNHREAAVELARAAEELRRGNSPFARWAVVYLASCEFFTDRFERANRRLVDLRRDSLRDRYPVLMAQTAWILGSIDILRGRPGEALPRFREAREIFARLGEIDRLAGIHHQIAITLGRVGRQDEAWAHVFEGLRVLPRLHTPRTVAGLLDEAGHICLEAGYPDVALYFRNEFLARALRRRDPEAIAGARLVRAQTLLPLGRRTDAMAEVAAALRQAKDIPEDELRRRAEAEILTVRSEALLSLDPRSAVRDLSLAIEHLEASGYHLQLPLAYFLRARAKTALRDVEAADGDFEKGIREVERARDSVLDPRLRKTFQDQATAFFDEVLTFLASHGDGPRAFATSERGRGRQLLESLAVASLSGDDDRPKSGLLTISEIRRTLPPETALIKYAVLDDHLLIWAVRSEAEEFHQLAASGPALGRSIRRARAALRAGGDRRNIRELEELYEQLVEPAARILVGIRQVVFVPDRELHLLPFAALVDPRSGRYLVENHAITVAPSANAYARLMERYRGRGELPLGNALVVGATEFDRSNAPSLPPLPQVEKEAMAVASLYPRAQLLLGRGATRSEFLAALGRDPEVIHFAGHAVPNPAFPELSLLLLAPDSGKSSSGAVYSHEVQGLRLGRTRLVVLSACDTAAFGQPDSEGPVGLARPFLAAGVPTVLASLAPVEDENGREILTRFHLRLLAGDSPAEALRAAQLSRLTAGGEAALPAHWASFEIIGGSTMRDQKEEEK